MGSKNIEEVKKVKLKKGQFNGSAELEWKEQDLRIPVKVTPYEDRRWLKIKQVKDYQYSRVLGASGEIHIPVQNLKVVSDPYEGETRKQFTNLILTDPIAAPAHTYVIGALFEDGFTLELDLASQFDPTVGRYLTPDEITLKMVETTQTYSALLGQLVTWAEKCDIVQLAKDLISVAIPQGKAGAQISPPLLDLEKGKLPTFCEIIPADDLGDPIIDVGLNRILVAVKLNPDDEDSDEDVKDILRSDELVYMTLGTRGLRRESKYQGVSRLEPILQVSLALKKYYQLHAPLAMISAYIAKQLVKINPEMVDDATALRINTFMSTLFKANTWAMAMPDWYNGVDIVKPEVDWDMFNGIENKLASVELAQLGVPKSSQNREQDLNRDIATIQAIQFVRFTRKPLEEAVMNVLENQLLNPLLSHLAGVPLDTIPVRIKIKRTEPEVAVDKMFDSLSEQKSLDITNGDLQQNQSQAVPEVQQTTSPFGASGSKQMLLKAVMNETNSLKAQLKLSQDKEKDIKLKLKEKELNLKERNVAAKEDIVKVIKKMGGKKT